MGNDDWRSGEVAGGQDEKLVMDRILGHRTRQRDRSQSGSWDDFQNRELVEVLLNYAVPRQDMSDLAFRLTNRFGGVMDVLTAPRDALLSVKGVTPAMADWLALTGELVAAYQATNGRDRIRMLRFDEVERFLRPRLGWARPPEAWVLYLDFEFCLISRQPLPVRAPWWSPENMHSMVRDSTSLKASYSILALFCEEDSPRLTEREMERLNDVCGTCRGVQAPLVDCVLAGPRELYSMRRHGRFDFFRDLQGHASLHEQYWGEQEEGYMRPMPDN